VALQWMTIKLIFLIAFYFLMLSVNLLAVNYKLLIVNCKLSLAALHADGRSNGGKYCDDKIDDLLDGFFSHGLMIY